MPATEDKFSPNVPGEGSLGEAAYPWGEGHFVQLFMGGHPVPSSHSPTLTGAPKVPTPDPGDESDTIASTAYADAAAELAKDRANHTGTQTAATISDLAAAVAALPAGVKAHDRNQDTHLAQGGGNEVSAAALRAHLDNSSLHAPLDDAATDNEHTWSAAKIIALIEATVGTGSEPIHIDAVIGAGALAKLNTVGADEIADAAVTPVKLEGGSAGLDPLRFYGTGPGGTVGFHGLASSIPLLEVAGAEQALLARDELGRLHARLGTAGDRAAAGNDGRFPTTGQKAALPGAAGAPGAENRYLTEDWAVQRTVSAADFDAASETAGIVAPATILARLGDYLSAPDLADPDKVEGGVIPLDFESIVYAAGDGTLADHLAGIAGGLAARVRFADLTDGNKVDGDRFDIDYPAQNYTPRIIGVPEALNTDSLAAHLAGIDEALGAGAVPDANGNLLAVSWVPEHYERTTGDGHEDASHLASHLAGIDLALDGRLRPEDVGDGAKLDGDVIDVDFAPSHYEPTVEGAPEAENAQSLAAHLKGVDNALAGVGGGSGGRQWLTYDLLAPDETWEAASSAPDSYKFVCRMPANVQVHSVVVAAVLNSASERTHVALVRRAGLTIFQAAFAPGVQLAKGVQGSGLAPDGTPAWASAGYRVDQGNIITCEVFRADYGEAWEDLKGLQVSIEVSPA